MNVKTLCLAILHSGDATGYEIKKLSMESKYSHFVDASFGSIYPSLARLEKDGMVTCREEIQPGKPPRKVYSITDAGRREFVQSLHEPPEPDIFRSEFLLIAMCADLLPRNVLARAIDVRIEQLEAEISHLDDMLQLKSETCTAENSGTLWAIKYGLTCMRASLMHLETTRTELESYGSDNGAEASAPAARTIEDVVA